MAQAEMVTQPVAYEIDGEAYEGVLVYDGSVQDKRPGLLMVPNWMGMTDNALKKAYRAGGSDYVVFVADMYGKSVRPSNAEEARDAATFVRSDRLLMRERVNAALEVFKQSDLAVLDSSKMGAIGFCFGGGVVLELARSGTDIDGVVSFHGNLDTPELDDAKAIKSPVLVLNGADDPAVPAEQIRTFEKEMRDAEVDWQFVNYGGAVHSFTDPTAATPGRNEYHPQVAARAFAAMQLFFAQSME
tara:strand:- start:19 stop:750 length:732 start_codon:yes stop_codon:yes gene_type:complete